MFVKPHPTAELKKFGDIEAWEWYVNGIRKLELTGEGCLTSYETEALLGHFVNEDHYSIILREDCDVYMPRENDLLAMFDSEETDEDRLLVSFRKGVVPQDLKNIAWENLISAATISDNRGIAGGPLEERLLRPQAQNGNLVQTNLTRGRYRLPDGSVGATSIGNQVSSGIMGNFDASPRVPYCRQTGWSKAHPKQTETVIPFLESLNKCFKAQAPVRWQRQYDFMEEAGIRPNGWALGDTVFTTVTVNKDWQTAVHRDAGDFPGGYGNLSVVEKRPYGGGYTGFPQFKVAADVRTGDFLAMNVHQPHGNTRMWPLNEPEEGEEWEDHRVPGADHGFDRLSIVCYCRYKMKECGTIDEEMERYGKWHEGFMTPKARRAHLERLRARQSQKMDEEVEYLQHLWEDAERED